MRSQLSLAALALFAAGAAAQTSVHVPNAIGVWNSSGCWQNHWYVGLFGPGYVDAYQALPPELTTYFGSQIAGGKRELVFRGFEMLTTYGQFSSQPNYPTPQLEIHDSAVHPNAPF